MLGRRQSIAIGIGIVTVSIVGGWIWSNASDNGNTDTITINTDDTSKEPGIGTNTPNQGRNVPTASLTNQNGDEVSTGDIVGRPTVLNFWYSTCEPCRREMPAFQAAHQKFGDRVRFIGINPQDTADTAASFADKYGVTYELWRDNDGKLTGKIGVATFPATFFVDATGKIVLQYGGELTSDALNAAIENAFGLK